MNTLAYALAFAGLALAVLGIVTVNRARAPDTEQIGFVGFVAGVALLAVATAALVL